MSNQNPGTSPPKPVIPGVAWQGLAAVVLIILALRIGYSITKRFDSDEPQHVHVVWAWTTGQLPYKDVFDNHAPLFQWLSAPILWLIGERSDIVIPMRWLMLPLYFLSLMFVFRAGRTVLNSTEAWWMAVFGCLMPPFFLTSIEYRPDDLWAVLWFAFLAVLLQGRATPRRAFGAGVLMGLNFAVSMKSTLLVLAIGLSLATLLVLKWVDKNARVEGKRLLQAGAAGLSGILLAPAAVVAFFTAKHAFPALRYCVIDHNIVPGLKRWGHPHYLDPWIIGLLVFLVVGAIVVYWQPAPGGVRDRRVLLFLAPCFYMLVLFGFWPDITREDDLPLYPLLPLAGYILLAPLAAGVAGSLAKRIGVLLPWAVFAGLMGWLLCYKHSEPLDHGHVGPQARRGPWVRENRRQMLTTARILKMTKPGEYVMDAKSGAVFRPRPFYYVLETVTRARIKDHLIVDDIPQKLIDTKTAVVDPRGLFRGSESETFAFENYLPLAGSTEIRVAGKVISSDPKPAGEPIPFEVNIPARYTILDDEKCAAGALDGATLDQPRELARGPHKFIPSSAHAHLTLFWAGAINGGFFPSPTKSAQENPKNPAENP